MTAARKFTASARRALLCSTALALGLAFGIPAPAAAASQERTASYDIQNQSLGVALREFGRLSGVQIIFSEDLVRGRTAPALRGDFAASEALDRLLAGSGLVAQRTPTGAVMIVRAGDRLQVEGATFLPDQATTVDEILVTGSRIRGAPPSAPVIRLTQDEMRNAGNANLGDAIRDLPQNFSGGQNPAVGPGSGSESGNANSTSQVNLRGLGPDATLTLLNGRRLSYSGVRQGVDITAIPLAAVERVEIVADGSSALYGSDAVGGVVNVILRRDFDGVSASARFGASTDGGNVQEQYTLAAGRIWDGGGLIATVNYEDATAITARQRSYTDRLQESQIIYPPIEAWGGILSGHQRLGSFADFRVDALYNRRDSFAGTPLGPTEDYDYFGSTVDMSLTSYLLSPSVAFDLPSGWRGELSIVHGRDTTDQTAAVYIGGALAQGIEGRFDNATRVYEATAEGPIFSAPGGNVRLAVGAGYREIEFESFSSSNPVIQANQNARFAYGEIHFPIVRQLALTTAVRYEDYEDLGDVVVPKIGLTFAPNPDWDFKASWGESFKTPTLNRQYMNEGATLVRASAAGGQGYDPDNLVLVRSGGNPDLDPERATTWSVTAVWHPQRLPGLDIGVSYFDVEYKDRVVVAVTSTPGALSNPLYASFITLNPSEAQLQEIIAGLTGTFTNNTGVPYTPENVVAVLDRRFQNVAEQRVQGVDASFAYTFDAGRYGSVATVAGGTYLTSDQIILPGQPSVDLSGTVFNPPRFRGRIGLAWSNGDFVLSPQLNYSGRLTDRRFATPEKLSSQVTYDLTARYRLRTLLPGDGDLEIAASVLNITNEAPEPIRTTLANDVPYESTNYSPRGRYVGITLTGRW
ncbi:TonB-dependent receptor [Brevundimonas abyssalis]|nr:TonB-dependent receptor [Brevundimonas abyssalis]